MATQPVAQSVRAPQQAVCGCVTGARARLQTRAKSECFYGEKEYKGRMLHFCCCVDKGKGKGAGLNFCTGCLLLLTPPIGLAARCLQRLSRAILTGGVMG